MQGQTCQEKTYFAIHHRFDLVDPRVSMLIDKVYAAITELTIKKSKIMMRLCLSHPITSDIMEDILARRDIRSCSLDVNLEEIINDVELACAGTVDNVPYRG